MGKIERSTSLIWRYLFRSLFFQMEDGVHAQARGKVVAFVMNNTLPDAVKDCGYMCECLVAAAPAQTLKYCHEGRGRQ